MREDPETLRFKARQARQLSNDAPSEGVRATLREMASAYEQRAEKLEHWARLRAAQRLARGG